MPMGECVWSCPGKTKPHHTLNSSSTCSTKARNTGADSTSDDPDIAEVSSDRMEDRICVELAEFLRVCPCAVEANSLTSAACVMSPNNVFRHLVNICTNPTSVAYHRQRDGKQHPNKHVLFSCCWYKPANDLVLLRVASTRRWCSGSAHMLAI